MITSDDPTSVPDGFKVLHVSPWEGSKRVRAGCPLQIVNASLTSSSRIMPIAPYTLRLTYRNTSGKDIRSVILTTWVSVTNGVNQGDSSIHHFNLVLSNRTLLSANVQATQGWSLGSNTTALDRFGISSVVFDDGTKWSSEQENCVFHYIQRDSTLRDLVNPK